MGTFFFYLLWPLVWFYAPLTVRVRVILRVQDEALVVKNWFGPNIWQLPGGGKKRHESVVTAAIREIKEELQVSLDAKQCSQLTMEPIVKSRAGLLMRYFIVEVRLDTKPSITTNNEITAYEWQPVSDITEIVPPAYT